MRDECEHGSLRAKCRVCQPQADLEACRRECEYLATGNHKVNQALRERAEAADRDVGYMLLRAQTAEKERDAARKAGDEAVAELLEALEDMLAVYGGLPNTFCFGEAETQDDDAKEAEAKARVAIAKARVLDTLAFGNDTEHVSPESGKLLDAVPVKK